MPMPTHHNEVVDNDSLGESGTWDTAGWRQFMETEENDFSTLSC